MEKRKFRFLRMPIGSDLTIFVCTITLALFGLVMSVSAGMTYATVDLNPLVMATIRHFAFFLISYFFMYVAASLFNFNLARKLLFIIVITTAIALLLPLLFDPVNGAHRWIRIMNFTIQPSEFAKVVMIVLIAIYLGDLKVTKRKGWDIVKAPFFILCIYGAIILFLQNDFGTALVIGAIAVICFLVPSNRCIRGFQRLVMAGTAVLVPLIVFLMSNRGIEFIRQTGLIRPWRLARIEMAGNPFTDRFNTGYQLVNSLIAFSNGGWFGVGLGRSIQKYGYLPEARTDFILAIIVEELGFVGAMFIFILYAFLIYRLFYYAFKIESEKGKIVLIGTAMYLFIHLVFNVGGVIGLIPLTGIPLLLISSGGSSTMAVFLAIGICQAVISKYNREKLESAR